MAPRLGEVDDPCPLLFWVNSDVALMQIPMLNSVIMQSQSGIKYGSSNDDW
jgi:hypothetical protein